MGLADGLRATRARTEVVNRQVLPDLKRTSSRRVARTQGLAEKKDLSEDIETQLKGALADFKSKGWKK